MQCNCATPLQRTQLVACVVAPEVVDEVVAVAIEVIVQPLQHVCQLPADLRWVCIGRLERCTTYTAAVVRTHTQHVKCGYSK